MVLLLHPMNQYKTFTIYSDWVISLYHFRKVKHNLTKWHLVSYNSKF